MAPDAPHRRPARPVADAPIERLLAHTEDVARRWMFALLAEVELHEAPGVVTEPFTRDGPRVCDAALRALAEESDLHRLEPGGALRPLVSRVGEMTGASAPAHVLTTVDALHDVLWRELRSELRGTEDADLVADVAARLTRVCALIRDAGLARAGGAPGLESLPPAGGPAAAGAPRRGAWPSGGPDAPSVEGPQPPAAETPVVEGSVGERRVEGTVGEDPAGELPVAEGAAEDVPAVERPVEEPRAREPGSARTAPLWIGALEDEIEAAKTAFAPLSLLLAELEDADRIAASAGPERSGEAFGEFARAVRRALRRQDILVQESATRVWVIARGTARAGAHSLGARIAESVGETSSLSGSPLVASVGVAVLAEDGIDCAQLMDAAEEARFAASARGIEVSRRMR